VDILFADEETIMSLDPDDVAALIERARRVCADIALVREEIVLTLAETRRLIGEAPPEAAYVPAQVASESVVEAPANMTDRARMMEAVRGLIAILTVFPIESQIKMVKILVARTIVVEVAPSPVRPITPTA
jgi:hypothetical protein